jgi:hypothetical protein
VNVQRNGSSRRRDEVLITPLPYVDAPSLAVRVAASPLNFVMQFPPKSLKTVIGFDRAQA